MDTPPQPNKVFDVSRPGASSPNPSSKPVLVSNRPEQDDPMMTPKTPPPAAVITPAKSSVVAPPSVAVPKAVVNGVEMPLMTASDTVIGKMEGQIRLWIGRFFFFLLIVIIAAIVVDLLLDAGVIHTGVKPLTHFFHHT